MKKVKKLGNFFGNYLLLKENVEKGNFLPSYKLLDDVDEPLPPAEGGDGEDHQHLHQGEGAGMQGQQHQYIL